jgi:hypothetical protein
LSLLANSTRAEPMDPPSHARLGPGLLLLARALFAAVALAAILCGARAIRRSAAYLVQPPRSVFHPAFRAELETVRRRLPEGAVVLHLSASPEYWFSRLWQRALYPRNETIVVQPPWDAARVRELKAKYHARFAISAGDPPSDPGFLWKMELAPPPLGPGSVWFGELRP